MKRLILILLPVLVVTTAVAVLAAVLSSEGSLPPQPINFNHRVHMERVQGIQCQNCHLFVNSEHFAGIPSKRLCFGCHEPDAPEADADANKPEYADLMAFAETEGDIPWHRVTAHRQDVFFSHRRHFKVGGIDCQRCHPGMAERTSPPTTGPIEMSMDECMDCHRQSGASNDCIVCHR